MTNAEAVQTLSAVFDALMCEPPRLDVAELLYHSIPEFEGLELPAPSDLQAAIHLRQTMADRKASMLASNERSDPGDNFASQHAMSLCRQRDAEQAAILERGGVHEFVGLFRKSDGARMPAKIIGNRYGKSWMVCDAERGTSTGVFYPVGGNSRKQKQAGLEERKETAPARAILAGRGHGNSGQAWVEVQRLDGGWPGAPEWRVKEGR